MSDFAKNQLLKFGWKEGKGLGKDENGITKPVKVTLKSGKEGFGLEKKPYNLWWVEEYNNAVKNIRVESNQDGAILSTVSDSWVLSKKKDNIPKIECINFQKTSVLHNGCLIQDNPTTSKEEKETTQCSVNVSSPIKQLHTAPDKEVGLDIETKPPCTSSAKLERIALQDQSLARLHDWLSACSAVPRLTPVNSSFSHIRGTKPKRATLKNINHTDIFTLMKEEEELYEANNNTMLQAIRTLTVKSRSRNKNFRKKINNLMQKLNDCSIQETDTTSKNDLSKEEVLRNIRKIKKRHECAHVHMMMKKKYIAPCTTKQEDASKQAKSQNEKEYEPIQVIQFGANDVTSSKEESDKPPHESPVKGSTLITLTRFGTSQHENTDMASAKRTKNSLYFHKPRKTRKSKHNKHKHNQRSKIEDIVQNIANKRDIDVVIKALTEINLTKDISTAIKKKPTQTHITPV